MSLLETGPHVHLASDATLTELWSELMGDGGFGVRTLWLLFVDREQWTLPVIAPGEDVPLRPDRRHLDGLFGLIQSLRRNDTVHGFAALLSRPGSASVSLDDRAWAAALTSTARDRRVPMWPVHLATHGQVRLLAADDLIGA
ncbi:hypothetical protein ACXR2U_01140 [Jatrophihabitans sp. YIM 134969]